MLDTLPAVVSQSGYTPAPRHQPASVIYLVSLPYPFGPEFEIVTWGDSAHARILWLLPITEAEKVFRREQGLEALECLFEERGIDPVDTKRPSVV
jgi:hypothetical protein